MMKQQAPSTCMASTDVNFMVHESQHCSKGSRTFRKFAYMPSHKGVCLTDRVSAKPCSLAGSLPVQDGPWPSQC